MMSLCQPLQGEAVLTVALFERSVFIQSSSALDKNVWWGIRTTGLIFDEVSSYLTDFDFSPEHDLKFPEGVTIGVAPFTGYDYYHLPKTYGWRTPSDPGVTTELCDTTFYSHVIRDVMHIDYPLIVRYAKYRDETGNLSPNRYSLIGYDGIGWWCMASLTSQLERSFKPVASWPLSRSISPISPQRTYLPFSRVRVPFVVGESSCSTHGTRYLTYKCDRCDEKADLTIPSILYHYCYPCYSVKDQTNRCLPGKNYGLSCSLCDDANSSVEVRGQLCLYRANFNSKAADVEILRSCTSGSFYIATEFGSDFALMFKKERDYWLHDCNLLDESEQAPLLNDMADSLSFQVESPINMRRAVDLAFVDERYLIRDHRTNTYWNICWRHCSCTYRSEAPRVLSHGERGDVCPSCKINERKTKGVLVFDAAPMEMRWKCDESCGYTQEIGEGTIFR